MTDCTHPVAATDSGSEGPPAVELRLEFGQPPPMRLVASTRALVEELFLGWVDADTASRVAMVAHELMENLAKYSAPDACSFKASATPCESSAVRLRIAATNRAPERSLTELRAILDDIALATDPHALYVRYMEASVSRGHGSKLGLVRVRAEGEMSMRYELAAPVITLFAESVVSRALGAPSVSDVVHPPKT
ncbi:MAG: hypothetical protein ACM3ZE_26700 [Myxococcales bacterium]